MTTRPLRILSSGLLAIAISVSVGCGGPRASVPVTARDQAMDASAACLEDVAKVSDTEFGKTKAYRRLQVSPAASKSFTQTGKPDPAFVKSRTVIESDFASLGGTNPELKKVIEPLLVQAAKIFATRKPPVTDSRYVCFTEAGIGSTRILILEERDSSVFSARYYPFGRLVLLADPTRFGDAGYANRVAFLIAHELGHGVAMHVEEQRTETRAAGEAVDAVAQLATEVAFNEGYRQLKQKNASAVQIIDRVAMELYPFLGLTPEDLANDAKIAAERGDSFAAKIARTAGQADKLRLIGVDLEIPARTKLVCMYLFKAGLSATGVMDALKGTVDETAFFVSSMAHDQDMEFEADRIGFEIYKAAGFPAADALAVLEAERVKQVAAGSKPSVFDSHPPAADRLSRLQQVAPGVQLAQATPAPKPAADVAVGSGSDLAPVGGAASRPAPADAAGPIAAAAPAAAPVVERTVPSEDMVAGPAVTNRPVAAVPASEPMPKPRLGSPDGAGNAPLKAMWLAQRLDILSASGWADAAEIADARRIYQELVPAVAAFQGGTGAQSGLKGEAKEALRRSGVHLWLMGAIPMPAKGN
jgi:hypothetical protein